ncbi:hypothetical protein SAMN00017477_1459 [Peptoniphilus asaccharolyticus DSM 20463]|uniref:Uncharacterized protein n=1 Tax=Peptoniphilus asaccharolyticus DSM 20463 TaxID=573058 RepID=A0A1W1V653_PEPAS|nr:DUF5633 domain-containing protein [Peptoniphilus asaccharolyticus]MBL7576014.1 DUF5633 domain-containing protein [Peptoniphilus asaccharolyticus]MBL7576398.1 DUF5633 domain-containing protein [Peptoniphilus asaccharolyticus]SMB88745.1 hypothetical protein SAMN00017477_1459 [Peptoniphilus asaccharolyticus DSM 20463]
MKNNFKKKAAVLALSGVLFLGGSSFGNVYAYNNLRPEHIKNAQTQEKADEERVKNLNRKQENNKPAPERLKPELTAGYNTKISAIFAALNHISDFNKGYEIVKGNDGLFYIRLLTEEVAKIR